MLRLSKLTDYAVVVLVRLADEEGVQTSPGIAAVTGMPEPTVAKVLKALAGGGLVDLASAAPAAATAWPAPLAAIPVADVIAAIDGPIALTACVEGATAGCEAEHLCPVPRPLGPGERRHHARRSTAISLADMRRRRRPARPPRRSPDRRRRSGRRIGRSRHARRRRNARHRPVRHPVRLQMGLRDRHRDGPRAQGPERGHHPPDLGAEGRARLAARLAAARPMPPGRP